jgi:hypothetical protein
MTPVSTDAVLAGIDATLEAWETDGDAARWHANGDGPDDLAQDQLTEWCLVYDVGGMRGMTATLVIDDECAAFYEVASRATVAACAQWIQSFADLSESIAKATAALFGFTWAFGDLHYHAEDAPRRVLLSCRLCHPHGNPARLAINGREYRRRQKARKR